jgi:hypothetical protein
LMEVEGDVEGDAEVFDELLVGVRFFAAEMVVDVDCGEACAERVALGFVCGVEGEKESYGVGSAGDGDTDAVSGFDLHAVEGEHEVMLLCPAGRPFCYVLPDGPAAHGAATSWRVYLVLAGLDSLGLALLSHWLS